MVLVWHLVLLLASTVTVTGLQSQFDSQGSLYIDCGLIDPPSFVARETNLTYVSDSKFIKTGNVSTISSDQISHDTTREELTLRYFPIGTRNCYTIRSLTVGVDYLIRAGFNYGNYEGKQHSPEFDVYIGNTFWSRVHYYTSGTEIIMTAAATYLEVCLVKTGNDTPFISWLSLRQLKKAIYPHANSTHSLVYVDRYNFGSSTRLVRYHNDTYDRWWFGIPGLFNVTFTNWTWFGVPGDLSIISTDSIVAVDSEFQTPAVVMQTAFTTSSPEIPMLYNISSDNSSTVHYVILHFSEIQKTSQNDLREFSIHELTTNTLISELVIPDWLSSKSISFTLTGSPQYQISLMATSNSTLPPLLNAVEHYIVATAAVELSTYAEDVAAINQIKENYNINNEVWIGDPCFPSNFVWPGINCAYNFTRITRLNLSSSGLAGPLIDSFGNLSALVSLDLSMNNLSGSLPYSLDLLTNLNYLDITGNNKLSTILPPKLHQKYEENKLFYLRNSSPKKKTVIIAIVVVIPLLVLAVACAIVWLWKRRKYYRNYGRTWEVGADKLPKIESRQFSYHDLKRITNGFKNNIGTGGFGCVFWGVLEDGVQVAVKMHSNSSSQGVKELLAEAETLSRVHHKNLVALIGYCIDRSCMALVYEYMQEGNLYDKLKDDEQPLAWKQRLRIAHESALGLEYLHKACNPPLIHRDVKTSNILLNASLQAKIADFGLSKTCNTIAVTHISTRVVGTPGYLDPEYYCSQGQLSVKSDVFSFGVVLLEIITGRPPLMACPNGENLVHWVHDKLSRGDIASIVDPKMHGEHDINSIWKVTNLACKCTELTSSERPTMTEVVSQLKESLDLEMSTEGMHNGSIYNLVTDVRQGSDLGVAYLASIPAPSPCVR